MKHFDTLSGKKSTVSGIRDLMFSFLRVGETKKTFVWRVSAGKDEFSKGSCDTCELNCRSSVDFEPLGDTMPKLPLSAWSGQFESRTHDTSTPFSWW